MTLSFSVREQKLRYQTPWRAIWYFCLPPVLIMVIQGLYNIVDKSLALQFAPQDLINNPWYISLYNQMHGSHVNVIPLKAMEQYINVATQYASQTYNLMWGFAIMVGLGCALNFSIAFGQRNKRKMEEIAGNGFTATILLSCLVSFVIFFLVFPGFHSIFITSQMGALYNPITEELAWQYSFPMLAAAPLMFLSYYFISLIRSEGRMYWTIASILTSIVINCLAAIFFMKVCHLGMSGAMLGTVFSWMTQVIWGLFIVFGLKNSYSRFTWKDMYRLKLDNLWLFSKTGFPNFLANVALVVTSYVSTSLVVKLPNQEVTGDNISILQQLMSSITPWMTLIISVGVGVAQGSRSILAYNYGAKKYLRIWEVLKRTSVLLVIWFTLGLVIFIIFGKQMMTLFAFPNEYANKYHWWLVLNFMTYPFCSVTYICLTLFQGINRSALSTFSNSLRSFVISLPLIGLGFCIAQATGRAIDYYITVGFIDLICASILIPFLIFFWFKYRSHLVDVISDIDRKYQPDVVLQNLQPDQKPSK